MSVGLVVAALTAVGAGAAAVPAGAAPEGAEQATAVERVPDAVKVPPGNRRIAVMPGRGVQTYQCTNGAWAFVQPDAILKHDGKARVLHSKGPVWTSVDDGSSVTAAVDGTSPVPNAIPQLRLKANGHSGPGLFSEVTFIQRLNTTGGLAPTGACTDGVTASIPYTADYTFWVAS